MKYKVCPLCDSALDFGEKCECQNTKEEERDEIQNSKPFEVSEGSDNDNRDNVLVMLRMLQSQLCPKRSI